MVRVRTGGARFAWRRLESAPAWDRDPNDSVLEKYRSQVAGYREARSINLGPKHLAAIARHAPSGGALLVLGCGAGAELMHPARLDCRVTGVDALPEMIEAARHVASAAGVTARLEVIDLRCIDALGGRYHAVYLTPLLYPFVAGRERRVTLLGRLAARLEPGGRLLFSASIHRGIWSRLQTRLAVRRHSQTTWPGEEGDWYTWYLTPHGTIGRSFLRRFSAGEVIAEARKAGFGSVTRRGSHFLVTNPGTG